PTTDADGWELGIPFQEDRWEVRPREFSVAGVTFHVTSATAQNHMPCHDPSPPAALTIGQCERADLIDVVKAIPAAHTIGFVFGSVGRRDGAGTPAPEPMAEEAFACVRIARKFGRRGGVWSAFDADILAENGDAAERDLALILVGGADANVVSAKVLQ